MSYHGNILVAVQQNSFFRKVLFTGEKSQLVVMEIPPGGEIGEETHEHVEQTLFFHTGSARAFLNGTEKDIVAGDVVVVTPGTRHNFVNTGTGPLKVYTVYTPPNHIDQTVHKTKDEADADAADEAFGQTAV